MSWPQTNFECLYAEPSRNGIYKPKEFHGSGTKIVNMGELFGHEFIGSQEMARLSMTDGELEKAGLRDGDLLFGRRSLIESGAGKCSLVDALDEPTTFESSIIRVRLNPEQCEPRFFYYWFRSPVGRGRVRAIVTGTNVKGIRGSELKDLLVPCPELKVQRGVVDIVRQYDDLIENNRRRIALLEEASRLLYREWFVHFRFPGHEHAKFIDGLPEGWQRQTFGGVCESVGGGTPATGKPELWTDGDIPWYTPTDITRNSCLALLDSATKITEAGLRGSSAKMLPAGTVLMTSRASVGFFGIIDTPACTNQGFISIVPHDERARMYLLHNLMQRVEEIRSHAGGATYKEINKSKFRGLDVTIPSSKLLQEFEKQATTLHEQVRNLHAMNQKLAKARDLLLPRLMSGELTV